MSTLTDAWRAWTAEAQINPPPSLDDSTNIIQTFGSTLSDADGDAWWEAVADEYNRLGIINPPSYVGLRNYADGNEQGANDLFDALQSAVLLLPETRPVTDAISLQTAIDDQSAIPGNQSIIENQKTGTNQQLDDAYQIGIEALTVLSADLQDLIDAQS